MIVAVIGSRSLNVDLEKFPPLDITEMVSGGAAGVDTLAKNYAINHNIKFTEFLPDYIKYGKLAPLKRNTLIIEYCDVVYAFWDNHSSGTLDSLKKAQKLDKKIFLYRLKKSNIIDI